MSQPDDQPQHAASGFEPPTAEELGAMLPHYEVEYLIASGGMGAVYKGRQVDLDRLVAIKVLPPEAGNDAESIGRFRSEARAMAKLNHPNIISIYDFGVENEQCYFIMEYVEGRNLHELITARAVTPEWAYYVVTQVCEALHYAHAKGIVHGDIKPANIVVDADGIVKLLDFGLARLMDHSASHDENWTPMGTPEYAAPELFSRGVRSDQRADIYSLGVVFYEMLVGRVPQGSYALPSSVVRTPVAVDDIILRCLRPDPAQRVASAAELKKMIMGLRQASGSAGKPVMIVRPPARRAPTGTTRPGGSTRSLPSATRAMPRAAATADSVRQRMLAQERSRKSTALTMGLIAGAIVIALIFLLINNNSSKNRTAPNEEQEKPAKDDTSTTSGTQKPPPSDPQITPVPVPPPTPPTPETDPGGTAMEVVGAPEDPATPETPGDTATVPPTPTDPPAPEVGVPTVAQPELPPLPADPEATTFPRLGQVKLAFAQRYRNEAHIKYMQRTAALAEKYLAALEKLETDYTTSGDPSSKALVAAEKERFANEKAPPANFSRHPKLGDLQRTLAQEQERARRDAGPLAAKLSKEYSEALALLRNQLRSESLREESDAAEAERNKLLADPDHLAILSGCKKPQGEVQPGNVALATNGTTAEADEGAETMLDGLKDHGVDRASGKPPAKFVITLPKVYLLESIYVYLPGGEGENFQYELETSLDGKKWNSVRKQSTNTRGEQIVSFAPMPVKFIRIVGTEVESPDTKRFPIKEVEAYCQGCTPKPIVQ